MLMCLKDTGDSSARSWAVVDFPVPGVPVMTMTGAVLVDESETIVNWTVNSDKKISAVLRPGMENLAGARPNLQNCFPARPGSTTLFLSLSRLCFPNFGPRDQKVPNNSRDGQRSEFLTWRVRCFAIRSIIVHMPWAGRRASHSSFILSPSFSR